MAKNEMAGRRRKSARPDADPAPSDPDAPPDSAFDIWLHRGLHQLYDGVAREPIPEELLRIIEADRTRSDADINDIGSPKPPPEDA